MLNDVLQFVQTAHPIYYFLLLIAAGCGLPVSEDALSVWAGALMGGDVLPLAAGWYVLALYTGVVMSDMWTLCLGRLMRRFLGERILSRLFRDPMRAAQALQRIAKYGNRIGFVQRFSLGARFPLAFLSGFSGISPWRFFCGTALGACFTLPLQLAVGYVLRAQIQTVLAVIARYAGWFAALVLTIVALWVWRMVRGLQERVHGSKQS